MKMDAICVNCGGEYGIHDGLTDRCPHKGVEAIRGEQKWETTVFQPVNEDAKKLRDVLAAARDTYEALDALYEEIVIAEMAGELSDAITEGTLNKVRAALRKAQGRVKS